MLCVDSIFLRSSVRFFIVFCSIEVAFSSNFRPEIASWGALGHLGATLGLQGEMFFGGVANGARLRSATWLQKSLPESRRVAPGTPLGHIFEARGRLFHGKIAARMHFYQISVRFCHERRFSHFWDRFLIDF